MAEKAADGPDRPHGEGTAHTRGATPSRTHRGTTALTQGPGRILTFLYGVLALSSTGRSAYQLSVQFHRAPLAYLLSGAAAVIYLVALVAILRQARLVAVVACSVEMVGVLTVGTVSYLAHSDFADATVWSDFGSGYGYFPLVLPFLALWWLWKAPSFTPGVNKQQHR